MDNCVNNCDLSQNECLDRCMMYAWEEGTCTFIFGDILGRRLSDATPSAPPPVPPGNGIPAGFSVWASDDPAFFGTKVGERDSASRIRTVVPLATSARYLTLKSYTHGETLRVDAFRAYGSLAPGESGPVFYPSVPPPTPPLVHPTPPPVPPVRRKLGEEQDDPVHWWNRLETHEGRLYPLRGPPDVDVASPASSMALAASVESKARGGVPNAWIGHNATLPPLCVLLNCTVGNALAIYEIDIGVYPFEVSRRDDYANAAWLLSAAVEPVVHTVANAALRCAAPEMCGEDCAFCPLTARGDSEPEEVIAAVEAELAGGEDASTDLVACLGEVACMDEVAQRAARRLGVQHALPPSDAAYAVAAANRALFDGFEAETKRGNPFNTTLYERHQLARAHGDALALAPAAWRSHGRRLGQTEETHGALKAHVQVNALRLLSSITCEKLGEEDYVLALEARLNATLRWSALGGGGNSKTNVETQWCWDCDMNRTLSCETHFMLVGRRLQLLRQKRDRERTAPSRSERRKLVEEHVRKQAPELCCARFEDGRADECHPKYCPYVFRDVALKRMGHVGRKLHETKHPTADKLGVDARVSVDAIHPEGHVDEGCRRPNRSAYGITDAECHAKSMLHHLGEKHGFSAEAIKEKAQQMGFDLGGGFQAMMRFFGRHGEKKASGDVRPGSPHGRGRRADDKAKADAQAADLLRRSNALAGSSAGRRMQEGRSGRKPRRQTRAVPAMHALGHFFNSTGETTKGFLRGERRMVEQQHEQNARRGRAPPRSRPVAEPGSLFGVLKRAAYSVSPTALTLAVSQSDGSFSRRFAPGFERVEQAIAKHRQHYADIVETRERRRLSRKRRLQQRHASAPHANQEVLAAMEERQRARSHRRGLVEMDANHALSWVHELVDFRELHAETLRLADVEASRSLLRADGRPWEYITDRFPTGYEAADSPAYRPSIVGDALRRLHHRITKGSDPKWHGRPLEHPAGASRGRRLARSFLSGTLAAPYAFSSTTLPSGASVPASSDSFWEAGVRYVVYSTLGCYLPPPENARPDTLGQTSAVDAEDDQSLPDGDPAAILRPAASKLCFPAVPFVVGRYPSFRDLTGTQGVDFKALTYERWCSGDGYAQSAAREMESLGLVSNASEKEIPGQAAPLRLGEAVDSVHNAYRSARSASAFEASGYLMCSIVEAGGILYSLVMGFGVLVLLMLIPLANWIGAFVANLGCAVVAFSAAAGDGGEGGEKRAGRLQATPAPNALPAAGPVASMSVGPHRLPRALRVRSGASFGERVASGGFFTALLATIAGGVESSSDEEEALVSAEAREP